MKTVYKIREVLTEEELSTVLRSLYIANPIGALVSNQEGAILAEHFGLEPVHLRAELAVSEALRIANVADRPVVVIGKFTEPIEEIEC